MKGAESRVESAWKLKGWWRGCFLKLWSGSEERLDRQVCKQAVSKGTLPWSCGDGGEALALLVLSEPLHSPR